MVDPRPGDDTTELLEVDVSSLTREQLIEHNLRVVEAHFHNENPDSVDKAIELYTPDIVWEAPFRGLVYKAAPATSTTSRRLPP